MSRVLLTSDWHLGHKAIIKYRKGFKTIQEHDETIINNYKQIVLKRDTVYYLGDICFTEESLEVIKGLQGKKILVMGNHDGQYFDRKLLWEAFDDIISLKNYKGSWLTHAPIHESELRNKYCIHGHTHNFSVKDSRYYNICVDKTDFKPVLFTDVFKDLQDRNPEYEIKRLKKIAQRSTRGV